MHSHDFPAGAATHTRAAAAAAPLEDDLRRFLGHVQGAEHDAFELSWRGLSEPGPAAEASVVAVPAGAEVRQAEVVAFRDHRQKDQKETPDALGDGPATAVTRLRDPGDTHAPELRPSLGPIRENADDAAIADLTERLRVSEHVSAAHRRRVHELELERSTALKTAEYLETQRALLAEEVRDAWGAHERDEQARVALEATLSAAQASHASALATVGDEADRLGRRLRDFESVHAETLALNVALRIEVDRLRAQLEDARATADAHEGSLAAQAHSVDDAKAESARVGDLLKASLADLEDLTSWARAKSARLADALRSAKYSAGR